MSAEVASPLTLIRPDLRTLEPYRHADVAAGLNRLHANESPWRPQGDTSEPGLNRYPEAYPRALEARLAKLYGVAPEQLIAARGSDECIDLIARVTLTAGRDALLYCPPTFVMYPVCAKIQGVRAVAVPLIGPGYDPDVVGILAAAQAGVRVVFLCTPNNPTGAAIPLGTIDALASQLAGRALLVVDEAYAEFSRVASATRLLARHGNLVVLRTLSKAYALAGARIGVALGHPDLIDVLRAVIQPFALASPSIAALEAALAPQTLAITRERIGLVCAERERLAARLAALGGIVEVYPSDANFLLVRCAQPERLLAAALDHGFLVRDFSNDAYIPGCVRITVGTREQNDGLVAAIATLGR